MGKMDLRYILVRKSFAFDMHCYLVFRSMKLYYSEIDTSDEK